MLQYEGQYNVGLLTTKVVHSIFLPICCFFERMHIDGHGKIKCGHKLEIIAISEIYKVSVKVLLYLRAKSLNH